MHQNSKLKLLLVVIFTHTAVSNQIVYITLTPASQCPNAESCLTLSTFAANTTNFLDSNTALILQPGNHIIDKEFTVSHVELFTLYANGSANASITCIDCVNLNFINITKLLISGLEFIRCSSNVQLVDRLTLEYSSFYGGNCSSALQLTHTNANITRSFFKYNTMGTNQNHVGFLQNITEINILSNLYKLCDIPRPSRIQCCSARVGGALVITSSDVEISNSSFDSNMAEVGGAIFSEMGSNVAIMNCTFVKNSATGYSNCHCHGGAIFINSGCTVKTDSNVFVNNTSGSGGGAIALFKGILTNSLDVFLGNIANRWGGAISAYDRSSIIIHDSRYSKTSAVCHGGVIFMSSQCNITMWDSFFHNNEASYGGVIYVYSNSTITVYKTSFYKNVAHYKGGVISANSNTIITLYNTFFGNNAAGDLAGVISTSSSSSINVHSCMFDNNLPIRYNAHGGVMYVTISSKINAYNCSFDNNGASKDGGVMYATYSSSISVYNSFFDKNCAIYSGAVLSAILFSSITVCNSSFYNNEAEVYAGVTYAWDSSIITIYDSFFENNSAGDDGGVIIAWYNSTITVYNSSFYNNDAGNFGGVIYVVSSNRIIVLNSSFQSNEAHYGGVIYASFSRRITAINSRGDSVTNLVIVNGSKFTYNNANRGGVIYLQSGSIASVCCSNFFHNSAKSDGGVIYSEKANWLTLINVQMNLNVAGEGGGVIFASFQCELSITGDECIFTENRARCGGVIYARDSKIDINSQSLLMANNTANEAGGVAQLLKTNATFLNSNHILLGNLACSGGVVYASESYINIHCQRMLMAENNAEMTGGALHLYKTNLTFIALKNTTVKYTADTLAVNAAQVHIFFSSNSTLIGNTANYGGAIYASESNLLMEMYSQTIVSANSAKNSGGGLYLTTSKLNVIGHSLFITGNRAQNSGGGLHVENSSIIFEEAVEFTSCNVSDNPYKSTYLFELIFPFSTRNRTTERNLLTIIYSQTNVSDNSALNNGGGMYLIASELKVSGCSSFIAGNRAGNKGGGVCAENSSIAVEGIVHFTKNEAKNGGGVSLERNSKYYGVSNEIYSNVIDFTSNVAHVYGGAVYVDDQTNPELCAAVGVQNATYTTECFSASVFMNWWNNSAGIAGSNLFGGLLDRCKVHNITFQGSESYLPLGLASFLSSSNISKSQLGTITSHPVSLCFCRDGQPDCDYKPEVLQVNRGKGFAIQLNTRDQFHRAVNASILSSLTSPTGSLSEGQDVQQINETCTELQFNIFSPRNIEELTMSIIGPCNVSRISQRRIMVEITCTCPIGFQKSDSAATSCDCICGQELQPYIRTQCNAESQTIIRKDNFWVTYINSTNSNSNLLIYPNCPYDYCYPPELQVQVDLNIPKESDAQCAENRSGRLCGSCKPGFSVSLGSSSCLCCPSYWPGLLVTTVIVFILSGIGLVVLILVLNLTVAIGTINAIIFYANIMAANRSALFLTSNVTVASVFISWINFEFGFDICLFDGLDTYAKTWLQLAFPVYIIFLVAVIIQSSYRFTSFGYLIGKKDPVATLATLSLLSYAKFSQTVITAFSSATMLYPDSSKVIVWLPDASVEYFSIKHSVLFFAVTLLLLIGLVYTFLLFTWQCFLRCPRKNVICVKFSSFLEIYHAPYTPKHRYWTGLLLLVRIAVYLVSASNPSNDPRVTLLSTIFIISCVVTYMTVFGIRLYRNQFVNVLENVTYFNIIATSLFTWYTLDSNKISQTVVTNISVGITIIQLTLIIPYHLYKFTNPKLISRIQKTAIFTKVKEIKLKKHKCKLLPSDNNVHQFCELSKPLELTVSVVELPEPYMAPPLQHVPQLEEIKDKPKLESHQPNEEESVIVLEKDMSSMTGESKVSINNCFEIEIPKFDTYSTTAGNRKGCRSKDMTVIEKSILVGHESDYQVELENSIVNQWAGEESELIAMPNTINPCQQGVSDSLHTIVVEAEIHN